MPYGVKHYTMDLKQWCVQLLQTPQMPYGVKHMTIGVTISVSLRTVTSDAIWRSVLLNRIIGHYWAKFHVMS
jgi:hypothetical protein